MSAINRLIPVLIVAAVLVGCGAGDTEGTLIQAATIGASGGTLNVENGIQVSIPAGALEKDVEINIYKSSMSSYKGLDTASDIWRVIPPVSFALPVKVSIPMTGNSPAGYARKMFVSAPGQDDAVTYGVPSAAASGNNMVGYATHLATAYVASSPVNQGCQGRFNKENGKIVDKVTGLEWVVMPYATGANFPMAKNICSPNGDGDAVTYGPWEANDWRLPTAQELMTLENQNLSDECRASELSVACFIDGDFSDCPVNGYWWTGTELDGNGVEVVNVSMNPWATARVGRYDTTPAVICVRGEAPACQQNCDGQDCGNDLVCGLSCGECEQGSICLSGKCVVFDCQQACEGMECGNDLICGQSCGQCDGDAVCESGKCVEPTCVPDCGSTVCGLDPVCGTEYCGRCSSPETCVSGQCVEPAVTDEMVLIPAGKFWMGCNEAIDMDCESNEIPYHEVDVGGFYIDIHEVTVAAFADCVTAGKCTEPGTGGFCNWNVAENDLHPVNCVTWDQARAYCDWAGKKLPTEAQWEKAARGYDGRIFPWLSNDSVCPEDVESPDYWCQAAGDLTPCDFSVMKENGIGCSTDGTLPVCSKSPQGDSPFGLCDMAGNVHEWVSDWYGYHYYSISPTTNPTGPLAGAGRIIRGGSLFSSESGLRVSARYGESPESVYDGLGFRCVQDM